MTSVSPHRILLKRAKEEKVSLNQYINYQLSRGVGYKITKKNNHPLMEKNQIFLG